MNIITLPNGARLVKRYRKGYCFAAAFSADTSDKQIQSAMAQGDASFFPYNEASGEFQWAKANRPLRFRK
jgi:hypothetical protein